MKSIPILLNYNTFFLFFVAFLRKPCYDYYIFMKGSILMHLEISKIDSTVRYIYKVDDTNHCAFLVNNSLISIKIIGYIEFNDLISALMEVTNRIVESGKTPQINISHARRNIRPLLINLAKKCGYKSIPSYGVHFSIWTYTKSSLN